MRRLPVLSSLRPLVSPRFSSRFSISSSGQSKKMTAPGKPMSSSNLVAWFCALQGSTNEHNTEAFACVWIKPGLCVYLRVRASLYICVFAHTRSLHPGLCWRKIHILDEYACPDHGQWTTHQFCIAHLLMTIDNKEWYLEPNAAQEAETGYHFKWRHCLTLGSHQ